MLGTSVCSRCNAERANHQCSLCVYRAIEENRANGFGKTVEDHEEIYHAFAHMSEEQRQKLKNKRIHEDLMNYQDKHNEEIERLKTENSNLDFIATNKIDIFKKENKNLSTLRKQALCMLDEEIDKNLSLKEENKTLRKKARQLFEQNKSLKALRKIELNKIDELYAQIDGERTCFGCKADIANAHTKPHICTVCDSKDNWVSE